MYKGMDFPLDVAFFFFSLNAPVEETFGSDY